MKSDFLIAVTQLAAERRLPREAVISAIEAALASAYKKDSVMAGQEISVSLNPANGEVRLTTHKTVVQKVEDPLKEISLAEAKKQKKDAALEDLMEVEFEIQSTGRIAAQTAKQVVLQRLREAERELVYEEYAEKEGDIVTATVQRADSRQVTLDLGRTEAVLPASEQVMTERYRPGQKLKVHVAEVRRSARGPEIVVSRAHKDLLRRLFEMEVPEIFNGVVEIKAVAREPGSRSKVAVHSRQDGVDPVGSCVGLRGIRIQNIVNELQGEKIDVVQWHADPSVFLANALSPCPVTRVDMDLEDNSALVVVPDRQLSLAIGKDGQNARLCAKLSGLRVSIKSVTEAEEERVQKAADLSQSLKETVEEEAEAVAVVAEAVVAEAEAVIEEAIETATPEPEPVLEAVAEEELAPVAEVEAGREISIEEQLAEATLEIETAQEEPAAAEQEAAQAPDIVWTVPQAPQETQRIRFAEEIMGPRGGGGRGRGRQGRDDDARSSPRRSRRNQQPRSQDEDLDDLA